MSRHPRSPSFYCHLFRRNVVVAYKEYYEDEDYDYGPDPAMDLPPLPNGTPRAYPSTGYSDDDDGGTGYLDQHGKRGYDEQPPVTKATTRMPSTGQKGYAAMPQTTAGANGKVAGPSGEWR